MVIYVVFSNRMAQRFWIGTCYQPSAPELSDGCVWIKGQQETCPTTGRLHWQLIAGFSKPQRLPAVKRLVCDGHWEPTRSLRADEYVWKDATSVEGTRFELGRKPVRRNISTDWDEIKASACAGNLDEIPSDIYVRYYRYFLTKIRSLQAIAADNRKAIGTEKTVHVYWGRTGTGKSKLAWEEAGMEAYCKDPRSKWWDGYKGETNVIIDEFRGIIDISHILRWLDRYPCRVEFKGGSRPLICNTLWITSNLAPTQWYAELDEETRLALMRRLTNIRHFE